MGFTSSRFPPWTSIFAPLFCIALTLCVAFSPGFLESDEIGHYLIARDSLHDWAYRVDIWGRPLCTNLYALGTLFGLVGSRLICAAVTLLTCVGTMKLGTQLFGPAPTRPSFARHRTACLWLLLFAQPFFLLNSATVMTEMLLAFCWVWAAVAFLNQRLLVASLLIGLGALGRPEGWFGVAAWPVFLFVVNEIELQSVPFLRGFLATFTAGVPALIWFLGGIWIKHDLFWVQKNWPWKPVSQYGASFLRFYTAVGVAAHGIWILAAIAAIWGIFRWRKNGKKDEPSHEVRRKVMLLVVPVFFFLVLHFVLGGFGLFASLAMPRYFVCVAPFIAILGFWGGVVIEQFAPGPALPGAAVAPATAKWRALLSAAAGGYVIFLCMFNVGVIIGGEKIPIKKPEDAVYFDAIAEVLPTILKREEWPEKLVAFNPYARYALDFPPECAWRSNNREFMMNAPAGTVILADNGLWENEGGPKPRDFYNWGYENDDRLQWKVDTAIKGVNAAQPGKVRVRMWIKQK